MNVYAFAEPPKDAYYRVFYYLRERNLIDEFKLFGKWDGLKVPHKFLKMQLADKIILGWAPYHSIIYYLLLLKSIKRDRLIYYTSWPYWNGTKCPHEPRFVEKPLWESFLYETKTVAVTKRAQNEVQKKGAIAYHIPHPVNTDFFKLKTMEMNDNKKIKVLFVGEIYELKGVSLLLEAARRLKEKNMEFWFVGRGINHLCRKILNAEKRLNVKYLGYIEHDKLPKVYNSVNIFVVPSKQELFGIALIEAMSCGLPCIATDCVGPSEIVENGRSGYLIPRGDINSLVEKLEILCENEKLRRRMGNEGRKIAVNKYDVKGIAKKWMELLKQ